MPATSIRDIAIKDDDLLAGTHGRGFYILDDISPLRQIEARTESEPVVLFKPARATRVRWNLNTDTPLPPDEPAAPNPPDGAVIDYWLGGGVRSPVTLEIHDRFGAVVRRFTSEDPPEKPIEGRNIPDYWIRPPQTLGTEAGMHRFVWNLREPDPVGVDFGYPIAAVFMNTAKEPTGPWVLPGAYTVHLIVGGKNYTQPLEVRMDPRVKTPTATLVRQHARSAALVEGVKRTSDALVAIRQLRAKVKDTRSSASGAVAQALDGFDQKLGALEGDGAAPSLGRLNGELGGLYGVLQDADVAPTTQTLAAISERQAHLKTLLARWQTVRTTDLGLLNRRLSSAGVAEIR
jgi:hypothetical protein